MKNEEDPLGRSGKTQFKVNISSLEISTMRNVLLKAHLFVLIQWKKKIKTEE